MLTKEVFFMEVVYPFPAIAGQDTMQKALLLCAINPRIGGLLIAGERHGKINGGAFLRVPFKSSLDSGW
jgi:hypothetical protein